MNTTGSLRHLSPSSEDFNAVIEMDRLQFPKPWTTKDWQDLDWNHHVLLAWKDSSRLMGFSLWTRVPLDDTAHLLKICVNESLRGSNVAREFWLKSVYDLKAQKVGRLYLEVEALNFRAIGFYQKCGFQSLRVIKGYYSDGGDALTMDMTI